MSGTRAWGGSGRTVRGLGAIWEQARKSEIAAQQVHDILFPPDDAVCFKPRLGEEWQRPHPMTEPGVTVRELQHGYPAFLTVEAAHGRALFSQRRTLQAVPL